MKNEVNVKSVFICLYLCLYMVSCMQRTMKSKTKDSEPLFEFKSDNVQKDFSTHQVSIAPQASCDNIDEITSKVYYHFAIHNEEDDVTNIESSNPKIPDYNGDSKVFEHYSKSTYNYLKMISEFNGAVSFQPDWTFIEGVKNFRPNFFNELKSIEGLKLDIGPHAHESSSNHRYENVYQDIINAGGNPPKILGGMTFKAFISDYVGWFENNSDWAIWEGPTGSSGHTTDYPPSKVMYRMPYPSLDQDKQDYNFYLFHSADSSLIVTGEGTDVEDLSTKPEGKYIATSYYFVGTRFFLADPNTTNLPADSQWIYSPQYLGGKDFDLSSVKIEQVKQYYEDVLKPLKDSGKLEFMTPSKTIALFKKYEHCLDLRDGEKVPTRANPIIDHGAGPSLDPCDFDEDGTVDDIESKKCAGTNPPTGTGTNPPTVNPPTIKNEVWATCKVKSSNGVRIEINNCMIHYTPDLPRDPLFTVSSNLNGKEWQLNLAVPMLQTKIIQLAIEKEFEIKFMIKNNKIVCLYLDSK